MGTHERSDRYNTCSKVPKMFTRAPVSEPIINNDDASGSSSDYTNCIQSCKLNTRVVSANVSLDTKSFTVLQFLQLWT